MQKNKIIKNIYNIQTEALKCELYYYFLKFSSSSAVFKSLI